jgi:hypothetical protein
MIAGGNECSREGVKVPAEGEGEDRNLAIGWAGDGKASWRR